MGTGSSSTSTLEQLRHDEIGRGISTHADLERRLERLHALDVCGFVESSRLEHDLERHPCASGVHPDRLDAMLEHERPHFRPGSTSRGLDPSSGGYLLVGSISSPAAGAGQLGGAMRASYSIHPPARGESVAWRVVRVYRDGVRRVGSIILEDWDRAQDVGQTALDEPGVRSIILEGRPAGFDEWRRDVEYSLEDEREAFGVAFHTLPAASGLSIHEQRGYWLENSSTGRVVSGWFSYSMSDSSVVVRRKVGGRRSVRFSTVDRGRFVLDSNAKPGVSTAWGWSL